MIRLEGIDVAFPSDGSALRVLTGLELTLRPAESVTVVGTNGAGKSTLLNVLAGSVRPTRGRVRLGERDITALSEHRRARWIARVFADPRAGTADALTIEENLALAADRGRRRGLRPALDRRLRARLREELASVGLGLEQRLATPARLLSSGQRQCLAVLMATLRTPRLLLLDEHVANLDPRTQATVLELTERVIRQHRLSALTVTHDLTQALAYGDRLLALHGGRVRVDARGNAKRALTRDGLARLYQPAASTATPAAAPFVPSST